MAIICGIDYSFTSPSICIHDESKELKFDNLKFFNMNDKKKMQGLYGNIDILTFPEYNTPEQRYRNICSWASGILVKEQVEKVCIEGYSFGSSSGLVFNIAENGSLIKQFMDLNGIPFNTPSPSQVKKNFTGKGNAKKPDMISKFEEIYGVDLHSLLNLTKNPDPNKPAKPIDDLVDSYAVLLCHKLF